jgi:hypothetical protein
VAKKKKKSQTQGYVTLIFSDKKKKKKKKKKRVSRGKRGKGSGFEREMSKMLSLWWTKGKREDVFWRSTTSGARATVRSRSGKATFGQYGDVQATDPIGQPLLDVCNIELKRGYSTQTVAHLLDSLPGNKPQAYELFIEQARADHKKAGSMFWLLIVKRDRRQPLVLIPIKFYNALQTELVLKGPFKRYIKIRHKGSEIFVCRLNTFLKKISPKGIKNLLK